MKKALGIGSEQSLRKSLAVVDQFMTKTIATRKATPSDDLLSRSMKKRDSNVGAVAVDGQVRRLSATSLDDAT